uniref:uncharacterized protein LOC117267409 isoform X1 n=1 Tax=Epinephelus lanceolatus TaxID=310571 RepID=UPI0014467CA0|nr:uncharacterized protein LOC117267409 isoform X1 [Epinephelus lanceolatus]
MPGAKRRYNVRFPPSRIKKMMQKDTEVGRIAMAVPVIISRALEMFLKSLLTKIYLITQSKFSAVVSVAHMKQCIDSEKLFDFLKDLAERATSMAAQKDTRGLSMWPLYRTKRPEVPVKKLSEVAEKKPRRSVDSLDNDSSSGVRILSAAELRFRFWLCSLRSSCSWSHHRLQSRSIYSDTLRFCSVAQTHQEELLFLLSPSGGAPVPPFTVSRTAQTQRKF